MKARRPEQEPRLRASIRTKCEGCRCRRPHRLVERRTVDGREVKSYLRCQICDRVRLLRRRRHARHVLEAMN